MAIETTPLGFKKPDGNEPIRGGDNVISHNAQKAQDLLADTRTRMVLAESALAESGATGPALVEDPDDPGTYVYPATVVTEDPDDAGTFLIGA